MIAQSVIEEIKERTDIYELINFYVPLKRAGGTFKALCPFHREKTPSFTVNPQRQIYHCFGCGKGGSVFQFLMDFMGVDFISAVKILAERANITIEYDAESQSRQDVRQKLIQINERAAVLFHSILLDKLRGEPARRYLAARNLDEEIIRTFKFGFAPDQWDTVFQWAGQEGFSPEEVESAGLLVRNEREGGRSHYDRFRNRLMIPIRDELGRAVAFTGRILGKDDSGAKYVNSPETPVFQKNRVLFGMDLARRPMADRRSAILCEGQIDCIRCHQAGFDNTVASQGTALTENHVRMIKRYCDELVIVLDPDVAGQNAALRALELCLDAEIGARVARLPPGEDPDSLISKHGREAFQAALDQAVSGVRFMVELHRERSDLASDAGLTRAEKAILEMIQRAPGAVLREKMLDEAAILLGVSPPALRGDFARMKQPRRPPPAPAAPQTLAPIQPDAAAPAAAACAPHELALVELLLSGAPEACDLVRDCLPLDHIANDGCREVVRQCLEQRDAPGAPVIRQTGEPSPEVERLIARFIAHPFRLQGEDYTPTLAARDIILTFYRKRTEAQKNRVKRLLAAAAPGEERDLLMLQHNQLTEDLAALRRGWDYAQNILHG